MEEGAGDGASVPGAKLHSGKQYLILFKTYLIEKINIILLWINGAD